MQVQKFKIKDLRPYEKNPRQNKAAIEYVVKSIDEFGFLVPLVIDKDNTIVAGHTRYAAAKKLGMTEVPCVVASDLTPDQIKAFRLVDNRSSEFAIWDYDLLSSELKDISLAFDMEPFEFDIQTDFAGFQGDESKGTQPTPDDADIYAEEEEEEPDYKQLTQGKVENILNLGYAQFDGVGKYDIPALDPVYTVPEVNEWIGFNYALSEKEPENKGVHFFVDDYQFERIWNRPNQYTEILSRFKAVIAPDFSPFGDMPLATQIFNHYRKHWVARYWQMNDLTVVPCIRASTDPRSMDFYLDGEPSGGVVAISSMWASTSPEALKNEFDQMVKRLKPIAIIVYGKILDWMEEYGIPLERIPDFSERRWG
jgi:hypothetical protein